MGSTTTYTIRDMTIEDRPRERLARNGAETLSPEELLAILLRVGVEGENALQVASRVLLERKGLLGLYRSTYSELCAIRGLGPAKAAQLLAAIQLGRKIASEEKKTDYVIRGPGDVFNLMNMDMLALDHEELWVLLLNTRNIVLSQDRLYVGSVNTSQVRVSEVFRGAIKANALSIILVHNHPSGDPSPSPEDISLTRAVIQAGKILDIEVLDHVVIGFHDFVSLKEKGFAFQK
jgi:DNA repair protein RadC